MTIRILSANVRGLNDQNKRRSIFKYYRDRCDILCLQETHATESTAKLWANEWGGISLFSNGVSNSRGVAILIKNKTPIMTLRCDRDNNGRILICDLADVNNLENKFTLVNVYAPNSDDPDFFHQLIKMTLDGQSHKILIGDFNISLDNQKDRKNTKETKHLSKQVLISAMAEWDWIDLWRVRNQNVSYFTWECLRPVYKASRIDYALTSIGMSSMIENITHTAGIRSDHNAIFVAVSLNNNKRGPGYWKMNSNIVMSTNHMQRIRDLIKNKSNEYKNKSAVDAWEMLKTDLAEELKQIGKEDKAQQDTIVADLSEKIYELQQIVYETPTANDLDKLFDLKQSLDNILEKKTEALIFRSKAKWFHLGEKPNKYFLNLEKNRYNSRTCSSLLNEKNEVIKDPKEILKMQENFYKKLYSDNEQVPFDLKNTNNTHLTDEESQYLDRQISELELATAIKDMKNGKTPGNDGLPAEFYKLFWSDIKSLFTSMVHTALEDQLLHKTARQGVINLIPKQNKDTRMLKNLRPITLLNVDYKIIEKCIANRMKTVMSKIIHIDQKGFMSDRRISSNIRKICDIISYTNFEDIPAQITSYDFKKAFDRITYNCLYEALKYFNFGENIVNWTKTLYTQFEAKVQNNGYFSEKIDIQRGVHQGGCCSSYYFLLCAEILAIELRNNKKITGLKIGDIEYLLGLFADDTDNYMGHNQESFENTLQTIQNYGRQSGLELNYDKTTVYRIGSLKQSDAELYTQPPLTWTNDPVNVLGIWVSNDETEMTNINFENLIERSNQTLTSWANRSLSLFGKILIVNSLIISQYIYKMAVLPFIPGDILSRINDMIENFLWNNRKPKIKRSLLENPIKWGGGKLVNLHRKEKSIKIAWIPEIKKDSNLANLVYQIIHPSMKELIWEININYKDVRFIKIKNKFWSDTLISWSELNFISEVYAPDKQIIWFNSHIRIEDKPIFWKNTFHSGLIYIEQLFVNNRLKSPYELTSQYALTTMQANSLVDALPKAWIKIIKNKESTKINENKEMLNKFIQCQKPASLAYTMLSNDGVNKNKLENVWKKWCSEGILDLEYTAFLKLFTKIKSFSNVPKYRSFQYRLLTRALVTNVDLYRWKIIGSPMCTFCNLCLETPIHLLFECIKVKDLWLDVSHYVLDKFKTPLRIEKESVITNKIAKKDCHYLNSIVLVVKQHIYMKRCMKQPLSRDVVIEVINRLQKTEMYIAKSCNTLKKHNSKWYTNASNCITSFDDIIEQYIEEM